MHTCCTLQAMRSGELLGYFVLPEVWCKMVLQQVKLSQSAGALLVLSTLVRGARPDALLPVLQDVCNVLADPLVCRVAEVT